MSGPKVDREAMQSMRAMPDFYGKSRAGSFNACNAAPVFYFRAASGQAWNMELQNYVELYRALGEGWL